MQNFGAFYIYRLASGGRFLHALAVSVLKCFVPLDYRLFQIQINCIMHRCCMFVKIIIKQSVDIVS
jgi:hypothetical protein